MAKYVAYYVDDDGVGTVTYLGYRWIEAKDDQDSLEVANNVRVDGLDFSGTDTLEEKHLNGLHPTIWWLGQAMVNGWYVKFSDELMDQDINVKIFG